MASSPRDPSTDPLAPVHAGGAFSLVVHPDGGQVRLELRGELDLFATRPARQRVDELVGAGFGEIVLDLRDLSFIDSTGMRLLLGLHLQARREGWTLLLIPGPEPVQRVFEIAGTASVLPFAHGADPV